LVFKPAGTVTGLYREDYGYNAAAAAFTMYRDVWREHQVSANETSSTDDSYEIRIVDRKKDKN
jgi:hypothetical protein